MKRRRHRLERAARWGCTVACAALLIAWPISMRWYLRLSLPPIAEHQSRITINNGSIYFGTVQVDEAAGMPPESCFQFGDNAKFVRVRRLLPFFGEFLWGWTACIPIWIPLAICTPATIALWRRRQLSNRGFSSSAACHYCGYSRNGLAPGAPCPECGAAPTPEAAG